MSKQVFKNIVQAALSLVVNTAEAEHCNTNELTKAVLSNSASNVCFFKRELGGLRAESSSCSYFQELLIA